MVHPFSLALYPGFVLAWSDDWPGLLSSAPTVAGLASEVPLALVEFRAWLASHGEVGSADGPWEASEIVDSAAAASPGAEFCFAADLSPLDDAAFERSLRHVELAAAELRRASALPDALLDWLPGGLAVEHADPWAPDPRTIRGILVHALQLEVYYREGLRNGPAAGIFGRVARPEAEMAATREALRGLAPQDRGRVFRPLRPGRTEPDDWTAKKVLRRLLAHHRAHTAEMIQRRTWLLLGVPRATG